MSNLRVVTSVYDKAGGTVVVENGQGTLVVQMVPGSPTPRKGDLIFVDDLPGKGAVGIAPWTPRLYYNDGLTDTLQPLRKYWRVSGVGVTITDDPVTDSHLLVISGGGHEIWDELTPLPHEPILAFVGAGVTASTDLTDPLHHKTVALIPGAHRILSDSTPLAQQPDLNIIGALVENDIPNNATKITMPSGGVSTLNLVDGDGATVVAVAPSAHSLIVGFAAHIVGATVKLPVAATGHFVIERRAAGSGQAWGAISPTFGVDADDYIDITVLSGWTTAISVKDDIRVNVVTSESMVGYTVGLHIIKD